MNKGVDRPVFDMERMKSLAKALFPQVVRIGEEIFGAENEDCLDRTCGFLIVQPVDTHPRRQDMMLNKILRLPGKSMDELEKYCSYANEKTVRLTKNIEGQRHLTSWESRHPEQGEWGGSIATPLDGTECIIALSGLDERIDEVFCLILAEQYAPRDHDIASRRGEILRRTGNPYYAAMSDAVFGSRIEV